MPVRMLREIADALEVFARQRPLLLVLEDLQWSDPSTVDLVGCIARRRQPARLLVVGSMRPVEKTLDDHPLRGIQHELQAKGLCQEIALGLLSPAESAPTSRRASAASRRARCSVWRRASTSAPRATPCSW